ncbi:cellulase family glycosylhydrolase [Sphingomonas sp. BN140010]|uniref:Cellulase family glycosylhydrolase n=1 Tax=Sphingomonas arvum TaxID=2992113 RepID=A0ABT3JCF8_9SPHN|nr:Calx-beta domain-containing protein [Sphingomonas sp. BN140010]MCW3796724.1 cellulase family glycosylhydrolase [Sphingomonas sp. BN140010]
MATIGLNISGGEFNGTGGSPDNGYHYPTLAELQYYNSKGVDLVRIPVGWERLQSALDGPLDLASDIAVLKQLLTDAGSLGMNVVLDLHNYGRYNGKAIGDVGGPTPAQFADFWQKMATEFKSYPALVGYDLMNEPHDMPVAGAWKAAAQAATDAIRTVDMKAIIYIEGDGWSSTHTWLDNNADLIITDPANRLIYTAHGYYDQFNEGAYRYTYEGEKAYPEIGVDRLKPFVDWLNAHGFKGMIGEFGAPSTDPRWLEIQKNALDYMVANKLEATAWGGGPWDTSYTLYMAKEGQPDSAYMNLMEGYFGSYVDPFTLAAPASGPPAVAVNDVAINEAGGVMVFTVTRAGDLSAASSVDFATADGTAIAGSDYLAAAGTLTFAAGQATATITVQIINDTLYEKGELLTLNLSGGVNATIVDAQGVGNIVSEDLSPTPNIPDGYPTTPTIVGSAGDDYINADWTKVDNIDAKGGNDFIVGAGNADFIDGGAGIDTISYHWSGSRVDVDLMRTFQGGGDANGDVLANIENVNGSGQGDTLRGDNGANVLNGLGGADTLTGRGGADVFLFSSASDANGDVITDYSAEDRLDFSAFAPKFLSLTNDGLNTRIVGDVNNDGVGDFTVTLNGVFTSVNGVLAPATNPPAVAPTVAINDVTAGEQAGSITFTVTRSGTLTNPSTVNFTTANGTATAGSDYQALSGTVSFAAGEATRTITVALTDDKLVENPETFFVNLSGGTNVTIADAQGVGTIISDDVAPAPVAPSVAVSDVTANEADGAMLFTLTRSGDLSAASSVNYATANGTATAGSDYTGTSGVVSFATGQATATVTVSLINDTAVENPETLFLNLTGGTNLTIADAQGVGTIVSEDVAPTPPTTPMPPAGFPTVPTIVGTSGNDNLNADWSKVDYVAAGAGDDFITGVGSADYIDGGAGIDTVSYHWSGARVDVDLLRTYQQNGDANGDVLVNIENVNGSGQNDTLRGDDGANVLNGLGGKDVLTGRGGADTFLFNSASDANGDVITDYTAEDRLDFSAFAPKFLSITNNGVNTTLTGDTDNDGVGDFTVTLNGVFTNVNGVTVGAPSTTAPSVTINDVAADERNGSVTFTITRTGSLTDVSTVNFATANGTATAGSDYTALSGTVSFAAGEATRTVTVGIINDTLVENPETFFVNLSGGTNVTITDAQGVATIASDDVAPTPTAPSVVVNDVTANEANGLLSFTLTRSGDLSSVSSVSYATANGTATAGSDYTAASGTVSFAAGQSTATVNVALINDTLVESNEAFTLNLSNGVNLTIADAQGVGTIVSDDTATPPTTPTVPSGFPTTPTITGTAGNDYINADWSKVDNVDAGAGDDFIVGVGSADYINGGVGSDTVSYHWSGSRVDVDLMRSSQLYGDAHGDVLVGIENINGSGYGDLLRGDDGANILNGLGGRDTLSGRGGADVFVFNSAADANGDVITDYSSADRLDFSAFNPKFLSITNNGVDTTIAGDTNGDGKADFTVVLNGVFATVNGIQLVGAAQALSSDTFI